MSSSSRTGGNPPTPPAQADEAPRLVDQIIDGRYRIVEPIGKGGMGWVYRVEHTGSKRDYALKILNQAYRHYPGITERFEREAFAGTRLHHPNLVAVSGCGSLTDGTLYLTMELVSGASLGAELDAHRDGLGTRRALHIARHVLRGLGHAHQAGIIHRDVKPDNVLLIRDGDDPDFAKLLDFGVAKLVGDAIADAGGKKLTEAGFTMGTPQYMSPEQALGRSIDARSDLYSVSILLFKMLTGRLPFRDRDKLNVLAMHATRRVPLFREVAPHLDIPLSVELMVRHGLAKDPAIRIASAELFIDRIDRVLASL